MANESKLTLQEAIAIQEGAATVSYASANLLSMGYEERARGWVSAYNEVMTTSEVQLPAFELVALAPERVWRSSSDGQLLAHVRSVGRIVVDMVLIMPATDGTPKAIEPRVLCVTPELDDLQDWCRLELKLAP